MLAAIGVFLACNTSHLFLPQIYKKEPKIEEKVLNIIDMCTEKIAREKIKKVFILGTEGTVESNIYQDTLTKMGIECVTPDLSEYILLRKCIESVKQNNYTDEVRHIFTELVNRYD